MGILFGPDPIQTDTENSPLENPQCVHDKNLRKPSDFGVEGISRTIGFLLSMHTHLAMRPCPVPRNH